MLSIKKITKTFLDLIKIDSPSGEEDQIAQFIISYLKPLGVTARRDEFGNVLARVPGTGAPLLLSAHMDTVEPGRGVKPRIKGDIIRTDETTILGADDKAGLTAILETVRALRTKKHQHRSLDLVFTREEEIGLRGALHLDHKWIKAKEGLVLDECEPIGHITVAAPCIYKIEIKIKGQAAHAGSNPEKGINAIQIASRAISDLKIGRINRHTTNNIGVIKGGTATNVISDTVEIKAEARSHSPKEAQAQVDIINKAFKKYVRRYKAKLYFKSWLDCSGYQHKANDKFVKQVAKANKNLRYKTIYGMSGTASDANIFNSKKIKTLDIGYGGARAHTRKEMIRVSELIGLTEWLVEFIKM